MVFHVVISLLIDMTLQFVQMQQRMRELKDVRTALSLSRFLPDLGVHIFMVVNRDEVIIVAGAATRR